MRGASLCLLLVVAAGLGAAPPEPAIGTLNRVEAEAVPVPAPAPVPPGPMSVSVGKIRVLKVDGYAGPPVQWNVVQPVDEATGVMRKVMGYTAVPKKTAVYGVLEGETVAGIHTFDVDTLCVTASGKGSGFVVVQAQAVDGAAIKTVAQIILRVNGARPPPDPPKPPEPPVPPKPPAPAKTFQIILVYESGDTLTAAKTSVLYGRAVEEYLTAHCTGGKAGWGRRDKDQDPAADTSPLKDLWAAVKPAVTSTPTVAIAVDSKVTLEPLPASTADMVKLLDKYREGR